VSPIAGWYADPSDAAQLRWWDGTRWTDDTRAQVPHTAPPPPGATATPPPTPPPAGPDPSPPGGFATGGWGAAGGFGSTGGYGSTGGGAPGPEFSYGFGGEASTGSGAAPPTAARPDRSWVSWASIGAAIAVALAVIVVLSVSLLGHQSHVSSSQGLTTPTSTGGSGAATTTPTTGSPTTSVVAPPPDSTPFSDPGGVYSISVNTAWEPPPETLGGVQLWYLTGVNYGGFRSNLNIVTQTVPAGLSLADYVQQNAQGLSRSTNFHVSGTTNITLADGTAATVVSYSGSELGEAVVGQATLTVHGTHAVVVTVLAATDAASTTFSLVNPYVATLHLN
jgi:hypothetical protein